MQITVYSHAGKNKQHSDDTVVVNNQYVNDASLLVEAETLGIVGVADGVGGNVGGKKSSIFVSKALCAINPEQLSCEAICQLFHDINTRLIQYAEGCPGEERMATTFSGLVMGEDGLYLVHVGNTRVYRLQEMYLRQVTIDQTTQQLLMSRYGFEEAEAVNKNEIYACMGGGNVDLFGPFLIEKIQTLQENGLFMITSDGIHDYVSVESMEDILISFETDQERVEVIARIAIENGSEDDKSIVLIRY